MLACARVRSRPLTVLGVVATVAALGVAGGACGPTGTTGVLLAWSFADGRDCSSAGTPTVRMTVRDLSTAAPISCFDGSATLQVASSGSKATVVAQDFVGVTPLPRRARAAFASALVDHRRSALHRRPLMLTTRM